MSEPDPTAEAVVIHSFVLLFPGQVLTDSRLRFATVMQGLRALHHSIPLDEQIPMLPFLSLADAWLLSYPPFPTSRPFSQATACIVSVIPAVSYLYTYIFFVYL